MLVKARDEKEEVSETGRVLHIMVRSQMVQPPPSYILALSSDEKQVINCFLCCKEPPLGVEWWMEFGTKDGIPSECAKLCLETVDMHAKMHAILVNATSSVNFIETVMNLLKAATKLDDSYQAWEDSLPPMWCSFPIAFCEDRGVSLKHSNLFPGRIDKYIDISIATARNVTRAARLILIGDIVRIRAWLCPSYQDYKTTSEYERWMRIALQSIEDTIASIPYFLGHLPESEANSPVAEGLFGTSSLAMFVTWPLGVIASSDFASAAQRTWVTGRLVYIAEEKGVGQASSFAEVRFSHFSPSIHIHFQHEVRKSGRGAKANKSNSLI